MFFNKIDKIYFILFAKIVICEKIVDDLSINLDNATFDSKNVFIFFFNDFN
jgi:hypothetical protein